MPVPTPSIRPPAPQSRRPLNAMIRGAMAALAAEPTLSGATARQITDHIVALYGQRYPIQTVLAALARMARRGRVTRVSHGLPGVAHRYYFHLNPSESDMRDTRAMQAFQSVADAFFNGNAQLALFELHKLLANRAPTESATKSPFL